MAVYFSTSDARGLLKAFDTAIAQKEEKGKITTWEKSDDGKYYTHKAKEWHAKAWFKPNTEDNRLTFNIVKSKNKNVTSSVYGYYHGHLIETFLNHFDDLFVAGQATALAARGDNCSS